VRVLRLVQGRCLVGWQAEDPQVSLGRLAELLPAALVADLRAHVLDLPPLLAEIGAHRRGYAEALEAYRPRTKSKILPLAWAEEIPADLDAARRVLSPPPPVGAEPVAAEALTVAGAVRRIAALWQDTEQVRFRRSYLRSLGEPQALPPRWIARLRAAAGHSPARPSTEVEE
jgi:hypothetical protein